MSRIIFQDTYIIVIPSFGEVSVHKHPFCHLFFGDGDCSIMINNQIQTAPIVAVGTNTKHILLDNHNVVMMLLMESDCYMSQQLSIGCQTNAKVQAIISQYASVFKTLPDENIVGIVNQIIDALGLTAVNSRKDSRVEELLDKIKSYEWIHKSIPELAECLYLSESRLTHIFKEEMFVSLKSYLILRRIEYAYKLILDGKSATYAALEAGFASASHLAYTCKKLTGISVREVLR